MQMLVSSTLNQTHSQTRQPLRLAERGDDWILQTVTRQIRLVFFSSVHDSSRSVDSTSVETVTHCKH